MMSNIRPLTDEELLGLGREDLALYTKALWPQFDLPPHLARLVDKLEALERGKLSRLIVAMPPRHGKSQLGSVFFPAWSLGRSPTRKVIFATYSQDLAEEIGRQVRNKLADPVHRLIFPACELSADSQAAHRFSTTAGGDYYAVGRGGAITGRGCELLVLDDPLKGVEEAQSAAIRRSLHTWFRTDVYSRLHPGAGILLISTRWAEDDLAGMLLREHAADGWEVLALPAIAETTNDPLGRAEGDPLWPARYSLDLLQDIKAHASPSYWSALYQQRPTPIEGAIFKRDWWRTYREQPASFDRIVMSVDSAFSSKETADYSAMTTWGETKTGFYLLGLWRGRVEFPELKRKLVVLAGERKPNVILIENRASGQSLIQELQRDTTLPIKPIDVSKDKVVRANAVTPTIEAGRVYLPEGASWLTDYLDELSSFPTARHDDLVDSTTMALDWMRRPSPVYSVEEWARAYGVTLPPVTDYS